MSADTPEMYREVCLAWLRDYLSEPHPLVGRDNAVCPFVQPSMQAGSLEIRVWRQSGEISLDTMTTVIESAEDEFRSIDWTGANSTLHALVVVLPGIPAESLGLLDQAHAATKDAAVGKRLMLGQFHPDCPEPASRNAGFLVSQSPVPMIAVRNMAFHDILFLHENPAWFEVYARQYAQRYRVDRTIDPMFLNLFFRAARKHGLPLPLERWRAAAGSVRPVPAKFARPVLDPAAACRLLGYELTGIGWTEEVDWLHQLLPAYSGEDGPRYDYHDVASLALAARTGRSVPEQAEAMTMRFSGDDPESWVVPSRWRVTIEWSCTAADCPGGSWDVGQPVLSERDELLEWQTDQSPAGARATGEVILAGAADTLRDERARQLFSRTLARMGRAGDLHYQWMPGAMRWDLDAALANRTIDCVSASLLMAREARRAGLETRMRSGILFGSVSIEHTWLEVLDEGRFKAIDPIMAFLTGRAGRRRDKAEAFFAGSRLNRLLPMGQPPTSPVSPPRPALHTCPAGGHARASISVFSPRSDVDIST